MNRSGERRPWLLAAGTSLVIALAYARVLGNGFVFDDAIFMEGDKRLESVKGIGRLFVEPLWGFLDTPGHGAIHQYYRPLQLLPLALAKILLGGSAWPVHLVSLVLHWCNTLMVYALLKRIAASPGVALVLAAAFALHPANSEAVLWAADIAGLGSTACILASVLVHAGVLRAWRGPLVVAPLVAAGLLFKETGVLAVPLMLAYDATIGFRSAQSPVRRGRLAVVIDYAAAIVALAGYSTMRTHALGGYLPGAAQLELSKPELVINAFAMIPKFVATFLWPFDLNMYRDFDVVRTFSDPRMLAGVAVAFVVAAAVAAAWRRRPSVAFGLAWLAIAALPYLFVRWPQLNAFAERYLYLPSIGLYVAMAVPLTAWLARNARMRAPAVGVACLVLSVFALRCFARTDDWKDDITLYTATLRQSPRAELIRNNLALRYLNVGRPLEGIPIQETLLEMDPRFPGGFHNLGLLLLAAGYPDNARDAFERAEQLEPGNAATALNLGYVCDMTGRREDAVVHYLRTLALAPEDSRAWYNLAVIARQQGQLANARHAAEETIARDPADTAARELLAAMRKDPPRSTSPEERRNTLRRCEQAKKIMDAGRPDEAVARLRAAAWLDETAALPHHYMANVAYTAGRLARAVEHERAALERDPGNDLYRKNLAALEHALIARGGGASAPAASTQADVRDAAP